MKAFYVELHLTETIVPKNGKSAFNNLGPRGLLHVRKNVDIRVRILVRKQQFSLYSSHSIGNVNVR